MSVSLLGTPVYNYGSANSLSVSVTTHSGNDRKILCATTMRATTPVINTPTLNGVSLTPRFNVVEGLTRTQFAYLDDADFPSTPGSYILATNTTGTDPRMAVTVMEIENAVQGGEQSAAANGSSDGSLVDLSVTPTTQGALVFCWSGRVGASAIDTVIDGSETDIYTGGDLIFDFSAFDASYVVHQFASQCACSVDISSANPIIGGAVAINTTVDPYSNDALFFGAGF